MEELTQKIKYVLENPDVAKRAGEKLFEKVQQLCDCEEYFSGLRILYHELVRK